MSDAPKVTTAPDLAKMAREVTRLHRSINEAAKSSLEMAIEAGEILITAKDIVGHGHWLKWLKDNCPTISKRTAQDYMWAFNNKEAVEEAMENTQCAAHLTSIRGAKAWLAGDDEEEEGEAESEENDNEEEESEAEEEEESEGESDNVGSSGSAAHVSALSTEQQCVAHLQALNAADEVFDLLRRTYDKEFLDQLQAKMFDWLHPEELKRRA